MSLVVSYLWRFWRRKSTLLGFTLVVTVFLLCTHFSSSNKRNSQEKTQILALIQKKLQQTNNNVNAADVGARGVQFVSDEDEGENSAQNERLRQKAINSAEVEYYRSKNRDLYALKSKAKKAKASMYRYVPPLQPFELNDNVEYFDINHNSNNNIVDFMKVPIYRAENTNSSDKPLYVPKQRLVHFDLKGAPPNVLYILKVIKMSKELGATGVLMEYEDMFPFEGDLKFIAASNHYTKDEIRTILRLCKQLGLDVIPLVQTFGHMEFVLKHREFAHLRDVPEMPESICPCREQSLDLVKKIIDQVMALHSDEDVRYLHIGCDEVYHLGECQECSNRGLNRNEIFVKHVVNVSEYVRHTYKVTPIIWDDMLRNFMLEELTPLGGGMVEPMVWVYAEDVYRFIPAYTWDRFSEVFDTIWAASAFKGAHGPTLLAPNVKRHLENNLNWLELMSSEGAKFKKGFRGIVITGWQRYDHFAVLCELLPAGLPSLTVNLLATSSGFFNETLQKSLYKALQCSTSRRNSSKFVDLNADPFLYDKLSWCFFPGSQFFKLTANLRGTTTEVKLYLKKITKDNAWMTDYNFRRNFSSPFRIDEGMEDWARINHAVLTLMKSAKFALAEMFDEYTQAEWIEQNIYPLYKELYDLRKKTGELRNRRFWPSRPFEPLTVLQDEFGIGIKSKHKNSDVIDSSDIRRQSATNISHLSAPASGKQPIVSRVLAVPVRPSNSIAGSIPSVQIVTQRPKRLVQQPDYYRHPPGS